MCLHFLVDVCVLCYGTGREERGRGKKPPPVAVRQKLSFFIFLFLRWPNIILPVFVDVIVVIERSAVVKINREEML
jgi:hypothetical protein